MLGLYAGGNARAEARKGVEHVMSTDAGNLSTVAFAAVSYVKFGAILVLGDILRGDVRGFILDSIVYHIVVRKANVPQHIVIFIEQ